MNAPRPDDARITRALADARQSVYWTDRPDRPAAGDPLEGTIRADLAIVGGGFTGLWAAAHALEADPGRSVVIVEAGRIGGGASGRNGGFVSASITHGVGHGAATWPDEIDLLQRIGRESFAGLAAFIARHGIEAGWRTPGEITVATRPHEVAGLRSLRDALVRHGDEADLLDADAIRDRIASPTYLGAVHQRTSYGLVHPGRLAEGIARVVRAAGGTIHEGSPVERLRSGPDGTVEIVTARGRILARRAIVATGGYPSPLRRMRHWILPVYDHILVTEPIPAATWAELRWEDRVGVADSGNRFHYYRPTDDGRILWGGWDANFHGGSRVDPRWEHDERTERTLAAHLLATFPQLDGIRIEHRWAGVIETTSRFTALFGTALGGRVAYAAGYTGLGVGASRFGGAVALDLVDGRRTERTELGIVRRKPIPFPPEPARSAVVRITKGALARADEEAGRRGAWLRLLDRLGVGFDS